jgi:hypothetical protein
MPRSEINNPTNRIMVLLDEMEEFIFAYDQMAELFAAAAPQYFATLPPRPDCTEFMVERRYRQAMGRKTTASREAMRRSRMRGTGRVVKRKGHLGKITTPERDPPEDLARAAEFNERLKSYEGKNPEDFKFNWEQIFLAKHLKELQIKPDDNAALFFAKASPIIAKNLILEKLSDEDAAAFEDELQKQIDLDELTKSEPGQAT